MAKIVTTLKKQPGETRLLGMSFKNKLSNGETITGFTSSISTPVGLTLDQHSLGDGTANILYSGGITGKTYKITIIVNTSEGQILENDGFLEIIEE